jgi:hypothetical protein
MREIEAKLVEPLFAIGAFRLDLTSLNLVFNFFLTLP